MLRINNFEGMQYARDGPKAGAKDYAFFNQQYATSSHQVDHDMNPALIVRPKQDEDVSAAVNWARENKVACAVKSGGHQYSGASSCGGKNIQIDLTNTYRDMMVLDETEGVPSDRALVMVGVSNQLQDFNAYLDHNDLFVPHGQCAYVCVGGHGQTGGYGQLGRAFGLFGDHIVRIRMICHDGAIQTITKETDPELFYAILGGSPGNFGIITHYTVMVYRAQSYMGSLVPGYNDKKGPHGLKGLWIYNHEVLVKLLSVVARMADDPKTPRNFDLCVSVLSTDFPVTMLFPSLKDDTAWKKVQNKIKSALADEVLDLLNGQFPAIIIVYAQWCPVTPEDKYDASVDAWFDQFRDLDSFFSDQTLRIDEFDQPMSKLSGQWIFPNKREFDLPYEKRTYLTKSRSLIEDKWPESVADRLDMIYDPYRKINHSQGEKEYELYDHCKLAVQIQPFGGDDSKYYTNRDNGTSYSWRDSTVVQVLDCFHDEGDKYREMARKWQHGNDKVMVGKDSLYSTEDRRVLWGSYGDWDLTKPEIWKTYYESEEKYRRIGRVRGRADPFGTFTANPFAVEAIRLPN
jgi:hypothetical protein